MSFRLAADRNWGVLMVHSAADGVAVTMSSVKAPEPRIGVIIPSFNDARIVHAIQSIRLRDPSNWTRIYIIDGGSRQEFLDLIRAHLRPHDYLNSAPDKGIFDALNKGLDVVREDFITWLGSDDFITRHVDFCAILDAFDHDSLDCYVYDLVFVDGQRSQRRTLAAAPTMANLRVGRHVQHFSSYWRMSSIGDVRFNIRYSYAADMDFFCRMALSGPLKTKLDNSVGTIARLGGHSSRGVRRIIEANAEVYSIFRSYMGAFQGLVATLFKLMRKAESKMTKSRYSIVDEMTDLIVRL